MTILNLLASVMLTSTPCIEPSQPALPSSVTSAAEASALDEEMRTYVATSWDYVQCLMQVSADVNTSEAARQSANQALQTHMASREQYTQNAKAMIAGY